MSTLDELRKTRVSPYQVQIQATAMVADGVFLLYQDNLKDDVSSLAKTIELGEFEFDCGAGFVNPYSEFASAYASNLRVLANEHGVAFSTSLFRQPYDGEHGSLANLQCLLSETLQPEGTKVDRSHPDSKDPDHLQQGEFEWPFSRLWNESFRRDPYFGWGTVFGTGFVSNTGKFQLFLLCLLSV